MKNKLTYYFLCSIVIGSTIYLTSQLGIAMPRFIRFYVNDFLIVPIVLFLVLIIVRAFKNEKNMLLSIGHIAYICAMYSVIFEFWLPTFHERYTYDLIDVALYFLSGGVFYILQKESKLNRKINET